ncbi:MAG: hypothetical protein L6R40_005576 [Gallowayella cf. fulva]|nr:MAG: hypothetical protein L6R40_005576 [Xanthomendoza cf. fulva]
MTDVSFVCPLPGASGALALTARRDLLSNASIEEWNEISDGHVERVQGPADSIQAPFPKVSNDAVIMQTFTTFTLLLAAVPVLAHRAHMQTGGRSTSVEVAICETQEPDDALRSLHKELSAQKKLRKVKPRDPESFLIETYFHFVVTEDTAKYYTPDVRNQLATAQLNALNNAYSTIGISFNLHDPSFNVNSSWATNGDELSMKTALRQGTYSALNIYFQSNLSSDGLQNDPSNFLLGYCELPTQVTRTTCSSQGSCTSRSTPPIYYKTDGCNVLLATMPGGGMQTYDQGKTAVHEVGHWFGLLHTFQDNSCASTSTGDYIDDTPQELTATDGCPTGKDSCPGSAGMDPIANYMDYSSDACYTNFTPLQGDRIIDLYKRMRQGA